MTEEELKKAMGKVIIISVIVLIIMIILAIVVFNDFGKSTTIFESETQKAEFENVISNKENENITENEIAEIENNIDDVGNELNIVVDEKIDSTQITE